MNIIFFLIKKMSRTQVLEINYESKMKLTTRLAGTEQRDRSLTLDCSFCLRLAKS